MKLPTYWRVWYLATDGIWHQVTCELGNISSIYFSDLKSAEAAAYRLSDGKDVMEVEVREERSVISLGGAAHSSQIKCAVTIDVTPPEPCGNPMPCHLHGPVAEKRKDEPTRDARNRPPDRSSTGNENVRQW